MSRYFLYVYKEKCKSCLSGDHSFTSHDKLDKNLTSTGRSGNIKRQQENTSENQATAEKKSKIVPDNKTMRPVSLLQLLEEDSNPEKQNKSTKTPTRASQDATYFVLDDLCTSESTLPCQKTSPLNSEFPSVMEKNTAEDDNNDNDDDDSGQNSIVAGNIQSRSGSQQEDAGIHRGRKRKRCMSDDEEEYNPGKSILATFAQ